MFVLFCMVFCETRVSNYILLNPGLQRVDRYGLARVHNKLIMHILPAERKFMRLSLAEVVRNSF